METKPYIYYGFARKKKIPNEHGNYVVCFPQPNKGENCIFEIQADNQQELNRKAEFHLIQRLSIQTHNYIPHIMKPLNYFEARACLPQGFIEMSILENRELIGVAVII